MALFLTRERLAMSGQDPDDYLKPLVSGHLSEKGLLYLVECVLEIAERGGCERMTIGQIVGGLRDFKWQEPPEEIAALPLMEDRLARRRSAHVRWQRSLPASWRALKDVPKRIDRIADSVAALDGYLPGASIPSLEARVASDLRRSARALRDRLVEVAKIGKKPRPVSYWLLQLLDRLAKAHGGKAPYEEAAELLRLCRDCYERDLIRRLKRATAIEKKVFQTRMKGIRSLSPSLDGETLRKLHERAKSNK